MLQWLQTRQGVISGSTRHNHVRHSRDIATHNAHGISFTKVVLYEIEHRRIYIWLEMWEEKLNQFLLS